MPFQHFFSQAKGRISDALLDCDNMLHIIFVINCVFDHNRLKLAGTVSSFYRFYVRITSDNIEFSSCCNVYFIIGTEVNNILVLIPGRIILTQAAAFRIILHFICCVFPKHTPIIQRDFAALLIDQE